jgi:hypothetical protein
LRTVQRVNRTCADVTKTTPSAAKFRFAAPTADAGFSAGILTSSGDQKTHFEAIYLAASNDIKKGRGGTIVNEPARATKPATGGTP